MGTAPALCPDLDASRFRSLAWGYPCDTQSDSRVSPEVTKLGHTFTHEWKDAPHQRPPPPGSVDRGSCRPSGQGALEPGR